MGNTQSLCEEAAPARESRSWGGGAAVAAGGGNGVLVEAGDVPAAMEGRGKAEHEEAADEEGKATVTLQTAPLDPRFPATNASRYCYTAYNEYYRCRAQGGEEGECQLYARKYRSMCPDEWIERWEELRAEGRWFGKY